MDNASGKRKPRKKAIDIVLLLGTSVLIAISGVAAFLLADKHNINPAWILAGGALILFFAVVGWGYRSKFASVEFVSFLLAWALVHVLAYLAVLAYLGFIYYLPIVAVELWIGYTIAICLFGPPPDSPLH